MLPLDRIDAADFLEIPAEVKVTEGTDKMIHGKRRFVFASVVLLAGVCSAERSAATGMSHHSLMGTIVNGQSRAILPSAFLAFSVHRRLSADAARFQTSQ